MGLFNRKEKPATEKRQIPQEIYTDTGTSLRIFLGNAKENDTALACQNRIADSISTLPLNLLERIGDGHQKATGNQLYDLVKYRPNTEEPPVVFFARVVRQMLQGNAYIYKQGAPGKLEALHVLEGKGMIVDRDEMNRKRYTYNGKALPREKIIHIPNIHYDGLRGYDVLEFMTKTLEVSNSLDSYAIDSHKNAIDNRLMVDISEKYPNGASPEQIKQMSGYLKKNYAGEDNVGKPLIIFDKIKAQLIGRNGSDISRELTTNRELQRKIIAGIYNVPLSLLGDQAANGKTLEQENQFFLQYTLTPYLMRIEQFMGLGLLGAGEARRYYFRYNTAGFLRTDYKTRMDGYVRGVTNGIYTLNDILRMEDLKQIPEDVGGQRFIAANLMPLRKDVLDAYMAKSKLAAEELTTGAGMGSNKT